jgi:hypothetical protein
MRQPNDPVLFRTMEEFGDGRIFKPWQMKLSMIGSIGATS